MGGMKAVWKKSGMKKVVWKVLRTKPFTDLRHFIGHRADDIDLFGVYPRLYRKCSRRPVNENKVVFIEVRLEGISNSFQLLYHELKDTYGFDVHVHNLRDTFVSYFEKSRRSKAMIRDLADAKYVFVGDGCPALSCLPLRKETVVVQTWHACGAFKRFGMSTASYLFGGSAKGQRRHPTHRNYTYATVSSPEVIWAYAEAFDMKDTDYEKVIVPTGVSRTDVFYDAKVREQAFAHLYEKFPAAKGKKVIFYAPTFRGRVGDAKTVQTFDVREFYKKLGDEYVLVIKHHPLVRELPALPKKLEGSFVYDATRTMSIEDLIMVSDICISDYSSVIYEYSLLERPMLFYAPDLEEYFDWRGFYYSYDELTPGPVFKTNEEMTDWIAHVDERFNKQEVIDFKNRFMASCDGHATQRILELAIGRDKLEKRLAGKK